MNYLQIEFEILKEGESEILVALLADAGFESFEERENSLLAFTKEDGFTEDVLEEMLKLVPANYAITVVPEENWNAQWESSFEPIIVNDFARRAPWVAIRAAFHQPIKNVQHEIIITPKMSFGTGHHATTYMMIKQMEELDFKNKKVADFGTGTAVLAILAEKLGAAVIDAIDNDDWSIKNSIENVAANNCSKINLHKAETIASDRTYDVILANINLNVIQANLAAIGFASRRGTRVLLSGFLKADEAILINALSGYHMTHCKTLQKGEWICMLMEMK